MDIYKLIDTVDKLNTKLSDLTKIEAAKKQVVEDVNRDIAKSRQLLEEQAKGLEKIIENKLNGIKKLDDELLKSRDLLAQMNNRQNANYSNVINNAPEADKAKIKPDNQAISLQERQSKADLMNSSLEDFIAQKFQEEYKVKYPENDNFRLTDKDFEIVLSTLREKAKQSGNLPQIIDEYLSSYSQTLNNSQIKILEQEKNRASTK